MKKSLSSNEKGRIGEAALIYVAAREGWGISLPHLCDLAYDVAIKIDKTSGWAKVQCKYAGVKRASAPPSVDLRRGRLANKKRYKKGDFEFLFIYDCEWHAGWLVPYNVISERVEVSPRLPKFQEYRVL